MKKEENDRIIAELNAYHESGMQAYNDFFKHAEADYKFANGDSRNGWQWDNDMLGALGTKIPNITVNKVKVHVKQILNDCLKEKMSMKVVGSGLSTPEPVVSAINGLLSYIEYKDNVQQNAYKTAITNQIVRGIGYVHVVTDYCSENSFEQEFLIKPVDDITKVIIDPYAKQLDASDANWCIIEEKLSWDEYKDLVGEGESNLFFVGRGADASSMRSFGGSDTPSIARFYKKKSKRDYVYAVPDSTTSGYKAVRASTLQKEVIEMYNELGYKRKRDDLVNVYCYTIAGNKVIDSTITVFDTIPVVPFIGDKVENRSKIDFPGIVRSLIDSQKIYNFAASQGLSVVASQTMTPWKADIKSIEGLEQYWHEANVKSRAVLPYNSVDKNGQSIAAPTREQPPMSSDGYNSLLVSSEHQMSMSTGQFDAEFGANGNETSGLAILSRQRQADTATYHFTDGQGAALRALAKIIINAFSKIYDTKRIAEIVSDGNVSKLYLDPEQDDFGYREINGNTVGDVARIEADEADEMMKTGDYILALNPEVVKFSVRAEVGQSFTSRRQLAFETYSRLGSSFPEIMSAAGGDIIMLSDLPGSDIIAKKINDAQNGVQQQQVQQATANLQQQLQQAQATIATLQQKLSDKTFDRQIDSARLNHDISVDSAKIILDNKKVDAQILSEVGSVAPQTTLPALEQAEQQLAGTPSPGPGQDGVQGPGPEPVPAPGPEPEAAQGTGAGDDTDDSLETLPTRIKRMPNMNPPGGLIKGPDSTVA